MKTAQIQKVERLPIADLKPFKRNPRKHSPEQIAQIIAAIRKWGWTIPVLIDGKKNILAGHGRVLAAKQMGLKVVPCLRKLGQWSEAERRAYIIADNKLTELAGWDIENLKMEMADLKQLGFDLKLTGFPMNEIAGLLGLGKEENPLDHWQGMPEFTQDEQAHRTIVMHFASDEDVEEFGRRLNLPVTDKTKFLWFPPLQDESYTDAAYVSHESILEATGKDDLENYLKLCLKHRPDVDIGLVRIAATASLKQLRGHDVANPEKALEIRWYESIERGEPDYSVYDDELFLGNLWACWCHYSRKYLMDIKKHLAGKMYVHSIADLGCGCGYTTAALKEIFPEAHVIGTNLPGTTQFKMAEEMGSLHGFTVHNVIREQADLIFASEYFEHFERPIEHLNDVLKVGRPKYLICANAFTASATGHFNEYLDGGTRISNRVIGREFNKVLKANNYAQLETSFWNKRPAVWSHDASN